MNFWVSASRGEIILLLAATELPVEVGWLFDVAAISGDLDPSEITASTAKE